MNRLLSLLLGAVGCAWHVRVLCSEGAELHTPPPSLCGTTRNFLKRLGFLVFEGLLHRTGKRLKPDWTWTGFSLAHGPAHPNLEQKDRNKLNWTDSF